MRLNESITVKAPEQAVWEAITDFTRYHDYIDELTRWEPVGDVNQAVGDRFQMRLKVGSAEVGGLIEIVERNECRDLAWTSITGIDQRGRWRVRPIDERRTKLQMRYAYGIAGGGISGLIAETVAAPTMRRIQRNALREIRKQLEAQVEAPQPA